MQQKQCNWIADKLKDMDENKDQDRQLFSQIAIDIREHTDKYRNAGEWLDKYWGEKRKIPQIRRFAKAGKDLLKKYEKQDFDFNTSFNRNEYIFISSIKEL